MTVTPQDNADELKAKICFILDKYYISNPLPPDDADIDMSITDLAVLFEARKLPSIHMNDVNGLNCPACGHPTLMLMSGNYITCCMADCPNPDYSDALEKTQKAREREAENRGRIQALREVVDNPNRKSYFFELLNNALKYQKQLTHPKPQAGVMERGASDARGHKTVT